MGEYHMAKHKHAGPSASTVSGHDIFQCFDTLWKIQEVEDVRFEIESNALGGIYMKCTVVYQRGDEEWECVSEDTWTPYSAPFQVHAYRCLFNACVEVEKSLLGIVSFNAKRVPPALPVEPLPPLPPSCQPAR